MHLKRLSIILLMVVLLAGILNTNGSGETQPRISITASSQSPNIGDIIAVTVSMTDFENLSIAMPSIHFNPNVLKVCDEHGNALTTAYENQSFYTPGAAIGGTPDETHWGGVIRSSEGYYPFFNNETGVIGMLAEYPGGSHTLSGTQSIYSLYMKVVGEGNADLHLSVSTDGDGDMNTTNDYDTSIYSGYPQGPARYTVPDIPFVQMNASVIATTARETVYTVAKGESTNANWCYIDDTFTLDVHVKNVGSMVSINLPLRYDMKDNNVHALLLDKSGNAVTPDTSKYDVFLQLSDDFELYEFSNYYPYFDVNDRYAQLLLLVKESSKTNGVLELGGADTLVCTLRFKAVSEADYMQDGFDRFAKQGVDNVYDGTSPFGVTITDIDRTSGIGSDIPIFPDQRNASFEIRAAKSKAPDNVAVIPNSDGTATVIVLGVTSGAEVNLYSQPDGLNKLTPVAAVADANGNAVFLKVPLEGTTNSRVWANAKEASKVVSDMAFGDPGYPPVLKVLTGFLEGERIDVAYNTAKNKIPNMPTVLTGTIGYMVQGYSGLFLTPDTVEIPMDSEGWLSDTYTANKSDVYSFNAMPDLEALPGLELFTIDDVGIGTLLPAVQKVHVNPYTGGGGGGGGSPVQTSTLLIKCVNRTTDDVLFTQTINKVVVGTAENVNAPNLEGYRLDDASSRKITVTAFAEKNVVIFYYIDGDKSGLLPEWRVPMLNDVDHYRYIFGYTKDNESQVEGEIRPERSISREEVAAIFYRLLKSEYRDEYRTQNNSFSDVDSSAWSLTEISTMQNAGIVQGYPDGTFQRTSPITRAEFIVMAMRFSTVHDGNGNFSDMEGHWAQSYIASASGVNWVEGYPDGTFRPEQHITRSEAVTIINRILRRRVDEKGIIKELITSWPDLPLDHWAYYEFQEATVSHEYERREADSIMENWTGAGVDVDFSKE